MAATATGATATGAMEAAERWLADERIGEGGNEIGGAGSRVRIEVQRVQQLDAIELDKQLLEMMRSQLARVFVLFPGGVLDKWGAEVSALLQTVIFSFSVYCDRPSPGSLLQNLQYLNNASDRPALHPKKGAMFHKLRTAQKAGYFALVVALPYAFAKLAMYMREHDWGLDDPQAYEIERQRREWRLRIYRLVRWGEKAFSLATVLNTLAFLHNGTYRTLVDRILRIRLVYVFPRISRQVSFDFLNQSLVWGGLSDFAVFLMPLIHSSWLARALMRLLRLGRPKEPDSDGCPICKSDSITTPVIASCGHMFCYYCLRASRIDDPNFACPLCDQAITSQRLITYD